MNLSIVIVNYKTKEFIFDSIRSVLKTHQGLKIEFVIVDNHSNDNIEKELLNQEFKSLCKFYQVGYNSGFSIANNIGIKNATGDYVLLLNPDTKIINQNTIVNCIEKLKTKEEKTILSCALKYENLAYQESCRIYFPGLLKSLYANPIIIKLAKNDLALALKKKTIIANNKNGYAKWLSGAFILFHRKTILQNNLFFEERFFLYSEDVEWSYSAIKKGFKLFYLKDEYIIHIGSVSTKNENIKNMQMMLSNWMFRRSSNGVFYFILWYLIVALNVLLDSFLDKNHSRTVIDSRKEFVLLTQNYFWKVLLFKKRYNNKIFNCYLKTNDFKKYF